jgi:hypothetical protein
LTHLSSTTSPIALTTTSTTSSVVVTFAKAFSPPAFTMADDIAIDKQLFHERLGNFITKWKADKRSGDQLFNGASSIAIVVGKASDPSTYLKASSFQVSVAESPGASR